MYHVEFMFDILMCFMNVFVSNVVISLRQQALSLRKNT